MKAWERPSVNFLIDRMCKLLSYKSAMLPLRRDVGHWGSFLSPRISLYRRYFSFEASPGVWICEDRSSRFLFPLKPLCMNKGYCNIAPTVIPGRLLCYLRNACENHKPVTGLVSLKNNPRALRDGSLFFFCFKYLPTEGLIHRENDSFID